MRATTATERAHLFRRHLLSFIAHARTMPSMEAPSSACAERVPQCKQTARTPSPDPPAPRSERDESDHRVLDAAKERAY